MFENGQSPSPALDGKALEAKFNQGVALHQRGQLADAARIYWDVLRQEANHFAAVHLLGVIAIQEQRSKEGVDLIKRAIRLNPNVAAAHINLAKALLDLKCFGEALESCDKAIGLEPNVAEAHNNRGNVFLALKRLDDALASFDRAIALGPDLAMAHNNRGMVLEKRQCPDEALISCDRAISLNPNFAAAHNNRGNALFARKRFAEALTSYDKAIELMPDFAMAHANRGMTLEYLGRPEDAFLAYDRAFSLDPQAIGVEGSRFGAKMQLCMWKDYESERSRLISSVQEGSPCCEPFSFLAISGSPADQLRCAEGWVANKVPASPKPVWNGDRSQHDRIRVAYLSADFRDHAASHLLIGVFEKHDKKQFETFAISFGPNNASKIRTRLINSFDQFIDVRTRTDIDVANLLKELEIDIAVDLMGFTASARTPIFAQRACPVQVNFLGYPGTMGADYIDYVIADRTLVPEAAERYFTEKVVYLPNSYYPTSYRVRGLEAERGFNRAEVGLPENGFVFCCFNNNFKITPEVFACWMRILKQVDRSVLWLFQSSASAAANLRKEAENLGVSGGRLVFAKRMSLPEHLARHQLADLFLDTRPYNAHTTASDALWSGLPVLTQIDDAFAARVAASLLTAVELPELITTTQKDYEELAIAVATSPERLAALKQKLSDNRAAMPLFDTPLYTQHLEMAYKAMYNHSRAGRQPEAIYVPQ